MSISVLEGTCGICSPATLQVTTEVGKLSHVLSEKGLATGEPGMEGSY